MVNCALPRTHSLHLHPFSHSPEFPNSPRPFNKFPTQRPAKQHSHPPATATSMTPTFSKPSTFSFSQNSLVLLSSSTQFEGQSFWHFVTANLTTRPDQGLQQQGNPDPIAVSLTNRKTTTQTSPTIHRTKSSNPESLSSLSRFRRFLLLPKLDLQLTWSHMSTQTIPILSVSTPTTSNPSPHHSRVSPSSHRFHAHRTRIETGSTYVSATVNTAEKTGTTISNKECTPPRHRT